MTQTKIQPLKRKIWTNFNTGKQRFERKDIKSAVEWLKKEINDYKEQGCNCHIDCINSIKEMIDEAFEDVIEK